MSADETSRNAKKATELLLEITNIILSLPSPLPSFVVQSYYRNLGIDYPGSKLRHKRRSRKLDSLVIQEPLFRWPYDPHVPNTLEKLLADIANLKHDQEEVSRDFRIAILKVLAEEFPELFLESAQRLLMSRENRKVKPEMLREVAAALTHLADGMEQRTRTNEDRPQPLSNQEPTGNNPSGAEKESRGR